MWHSCKFSASWTRLASLLSLFIAPRSMLECLHGVMPSGKSGEGCAHSEKGCPCHCPSPLSWQASSSLRGQPPDHPLIGEVSGEWECPWFRRQHPKHPFPGCPRPFSSILTPGREAELARVNENSLASVPHCWVKMGI